MKKFNSSMMAVMFIVVIVVAGYHSAAQTEFVQHIVTDNFTKGADVIAVDLDQDGNMDIVATNSNTIAEVGWWKNDGENNFTKIVVCDNLNSGRSVRAADVNSDQEIDLVVAVYGENSIVYLENNGDESFTKKIIDNNFVGAHTIDLKDMNEDGHLDILCSGFDYWYHNGEIAWWESDGEEEISWTKHLISDRFQQSPFIFAEDMDGDNDLDVVACGELNDEILWWENDGNENFTEHMVDDDLDAVHTVFIRDVDLDGDMDILAAACMSSQVAWYENDGSQTFTKHNLGYCAGALWLDTADLDNDGDLDLIAAPQGSPRLNWYENPGDQQFVKRIIDSPFSQAFCTVATLMDDDDNLDLVAVGWQSNTISWFENKLESVNLLDKPESVVFDADNNRYLVSNFGNGNIIQIDSNGQHQYFSTLADQLVGLHIVGDVLYASSNTGQYDGILGFDLSSGELVSRTVIENKGLLNDITSDTEGNLYITDSEAHKIYKVRPEDSTYTVFVGSGLGNPNGIYFDEPENRLLVLNGSMLFRPILAVDLSDSSTSVVAETSINGLDGLTADAQGNFYFSSWEYDAIYKYDESFTNPPEQVSYGHKNPADIFFNQVHEVMAVPCFSGDTLELVPMGTTNVWTNARDPKPGLNAFPNPFNSDITFEYSVQKSCKVDISLYDLTGQCVMNLVQKHTKKGDFEVNWSGENQNGLDLQSGIYFCKFIAGKQCLTLKVVKTD